MAADVEALGSHSNNTEEDDGDEDVDGNGGDGGDEEKEDEDDDNAVDLKQLDFSSQMVNLGPGALLKGTVPNAGTFLMTTKIYNIYKMQHFSAMGIMHPRCLCQLLAT